MEPNFGRSSSPISRLIAYAVDKLQTTRSAMRFGPPSTAGPAPGASLLLSMFTHNARLEPMHEGDLQGHHYRLMISQPLGPPLAEGAGPTHSGPARLIMTVDLSQPSPVHVAGFGLQDSSFATALDNTGVDEQMEIVELEGDFPTYFRLYCDPGQPIELRQVLNPAIMQVLVRTCGQLQWELCGTQLIFAQSDAPTAATEDSAGLVEGAEIFLREVLPTLERVKLEK